MKRLIPYIILDGQAKEAVAFYEKALGGEVLGVITYGEMPENPEFPLPPETKNRVAHAMLKVGETALMLSDTFPGQPWNQGSHLNICIMTDDEQKSAQMYEALQQDGGQAVMPLQKTEWSPAYGIVTDRYGVTFQITTEVQQ